MSVPELTAALELYDRHVPLFMGTVAPPRGYGLRYLEVGVTSPGRDGTNRHQRMLQEHAFDIAELSLAAYIIAKASGSKMTAVPVFPRRLFSQNHIYVNTRAGIRKPADLAGKRVAIRAFQVTMSVLARGDLQRDYGVPIDTIIWVTQRPEHLDFEPRGLKTEAAPNGRAIADLLLAGEVDALIDPGAPLSILRSPDIVRPLFADPRAESSAHFQRHGYYPLMHVVALKPGVAERHPDLPAYLVSSWEEAKHETRRLYEDFAFPISPLGRYAYADDEARFGVDPWPSGIAANRQALEDFIGYLVDQSLIAEPIRVDDLFHASLLSS